VIPASPIPNFRTARDFLLANATNYHQASSHFTWPAPDEFNWALDWFDAVLAIEHADERALWIVDAAGEHQHWTFAHLAERSGQVANWLRETGVNRGDRVLVQLGNQVELWETLLALMKLGAVAVPTSPLLDPDEVATRMARASIKHLIVRSDRTAPLPATTRIAVGAKVDGWLPYGAAAEASCGFVSGEPTKATDPLLVLFTPGTTGSPKAIVHSHASYPVGHLTTMYWVGLHPGDVHLSVSTPGWAKHLCGNLFTPWNAAACVLVYAVPQPSPQAFLNLLAECGVTSMCAPPRAWQTLATLDLEAWRPALSRLRSLVTVSEPLSPQVIDRIRQAWGLTVREGYGQSETTALLGNTPGQPVTLGSMGRPLPGCPVLVLDPATGREVGPGVEGELCLDLKGRPLGLMSNYLDDVRPGDYYRTGDVVVADELGYCRYIGRLEDVFRAADDQRISPVELESVLAEHEAVGEAAVVPALQGVTKAFVDLVEGYPADSETARDILRHAHARLLPYQRVRLLEFGPLPRTVSGKVRRNELRRLERNRPGRQTLEYRSEDFPELFD
jgi:acetyl-CoA synthetase